MLSPVRRGLIVLISDHYYDTSWYEVATTALPFYTISIVDVKKRSNKNKKR